MRAALTMGCVVALACAASAQTKAVRVTAHAPGCTQTGALGALERRSSRCADDCRIDAEGAEGHTKKKRPKRRRRAGDHRGWPYVLGFGHPHLLPSIENTGAEGFAVFRGELYVTGEIEGVSDGVQIHYNDVEQEGLATCYFAAALIAVAKSDPRLIRKMITDHRDGTYTVYLHRVMNGKDAQVKVDNRFPYETEDEEKLPAFFPLSDQREDGDDVIWELWPQVVEKAWASFKGGYEEIEWSRASYVFDWISGIKSKTHHTKDLTAKQIDARIRKAMAAGHPVVLGSKSGGGSAPGELGIVGKHSYIVMEARDGEGFVLFNPWHSSHPPRPVTAEEIKAGFTRVYEGQF